MEKKIPLVFLLLMILSAVNSIGEVAIPKIPDGDLSAKVIDFDKERYYAVYSAPDDDSLRGANGRARVNTRDWVQVFGSDGSFLLVQYGTMENRLRIGYILKSALPKEEQVITLRFDNTPAILNTDIVVTDDPLSSKSELVKLSAGEQVTHLANMSEWCYIEGAQNEKRFRGFVPASALMDCKTITDLEEAKRALAGAWSLVAGKGIAAEAFSFSADGTVISSQWNGTWTLHRLDAGTNPYLNAPEFELSLTHNGQSERHGLRICVKPDDGSSILILSGENGSRNLTKYE